MAHPALTNAQKTQVIIDWENTVRAGFQHNVVTVFDGAQHVNINCYDFRLGVAHFSSNAHNRYQYKRTFGGHRYGWSSHTVPFLLDPVLDVDGNPNTASHLCHRSYCHNPLHIAWESLNTNKGRNWCPGPNGPGGCQHTVPCIMQGPLYRNGVTSAAPKQIGANFGL